METVTAGGRDSTTPRGRRLFGVFIACFCLLAAVQTEGRVHRLVLLDRGATAAERLSAQLQTWRVWAERTPTPPLCNLQTRPELAPDVYRLLTAAVCRVLVALPGSEHLYGLVWILACWGLLLSLFHLSRLWLTPAGGFMAILGALAITSAGWQTPDLSAVLQGLLLTLALWTMLSRRWAWLTVAAVLLVLNREDSVLLPALAGLLWLLDRRRPEWLRVALLTAGLWLVFRLVAVALIGQRPYYCPVWQVGYNLQSLQLLVTSGNLHHPITDFFTALLPWAVAALWPAREKPAFFRAALWIFGLYVVAVFLVARWQEAHRWLQLLPLLVPAALWRLFPALRLTDSPPAEDAS